MEEHEDGTQTGAIYDIEPENGEGKKEELRELLHFIEETNAVNASNRQLKKLRDMVEDVKTDKEVNLMYLKIKEREAEIRREVEKEKDTVIQKLEEEKREADQQRQKLEEELCRLKEKYEK
ncbi:MAG: hypothetical protein PHN80_05525 [Hespellia sp.]|nr:hypothetical protein [Hespellia sp.]